MFHARNSSRPFLPTRVDDGYWACAPHRVPPPHRTCRLRRSNCSQTQPNRQSLFRPAVEPTRRSRLPPLATPADNADHCLTTVPRQHRGRAATAPSSRCCLVVGTGATDGVIGRMISRVHLEQAWHGDSCMIGRWAPTGVTWLTSSPVMGSGHELATCVAHVHRRHRTGEASHLFCIPPPTTITAPSSGWQSRGGSPRIDLRRSRLRSRSRAVIGACALTATAPAPDSLVATTTSGSPRAHQRLHR